MQSQFYVSKDGKDHGPWSIDQLIENLSTSVISPTDYVFDEEKQDWVPIMEFAPVSARLKGSKPKAPPKAANVHAAEHIEQAYGDQSVSSKTSAKSQPLPAQHADHTDGHSEEWYVLKWDNRYGPFSFNDLLKMLQEKNIFEFDFVWKQGFEGWSRIAELKEFSTESIQALAQKQGKATEDVFFRRRHARTRHNASIIVHDGQNVWKGTSLEISEGGAGLVMQNALILPGQKVYLHFKPGDSVPPFNAVCEIVSKQYVKGVKNKDAPIGYGIKFLEISGDVQKVIRKIANKAVA